MAGMAKELIIQTVFELLNERPVSKITVKDIVERCGINRNTFYYHFRDITDVMEFAFKREMNRIMETRLDAEDILEGLLQIMDELRENKRAILHIYRSMDRAVMQHELDVMCEYIVSNYMLRATYYIDIGKLSEEDQRLMKNFQKCILEGVLLDWLEHGMNEDLSAGVKRAMELLYPIMSQHTDA
ncbi:MAG: TetR/AcrR family transcriptional regulator [Lachnospiraceae bacterium]|nr:TetR/AcrR family transcriptional regulator [Lachnospiraceae bacterium]